MSELSVEQQDQEIGSLLEAVFLHYDYDFRGYSKTSLRRRILHWQKVSGISKLTEMQDRLLHDTSLFERFLVELTVNITAMFRDPSFYRSLRECIGEVYEKSGHIKVWCAGCATGEEAYSLAIVLQEMGVYDHARLYATDINEAVLRTAKSGVYPIDRMQEYTRNYQAAGGTHSLTDYFTADDRNVIAHDSLKKNIVFSNHNLAMDDVFSRVDIVVCRNVMIYFGKQLQNRIFELFRDSLEPGGLLCLGSKESAFFNESAAHFQEVDRREKIYRLVNPMAPAVLEIGDAQ